MVEWEKELHATQKKTPRVRKRKETRMPCTTILVGKKASHDGSTIIARNDDGRFEAKRVLAHPAREKATTYKTVISHLTVELPGNAMR